MQRDPTWSLVSPVQCFSQNGRNTERENTGVPHRSETRNARTQGCQAGLKHGTRNTERETRARRRARNAERGTRRSAKLAPYHCAGTATGIDWARSAEPRVPGAERKQRPKSSVAVLLGAERTTNCAHE